MHTFTRKTSHVVSSNLYRTFVAAAAAAVVESLARDLVRLAQSKNRLDFQVAKHWTLGQKLRCFRYPSAQPPPHKLSIGIRIMCTGWFSEPTRSLGRLSDVDAQVNKDALCHIHSWFDTYRCL
jgi:hypothetical protein